MTRHAPEVLRYWPFIALGLALAIMLCCSILSIATRFSRLQLVYPICLAAASLALLTHLVAMLYDLTLSTTINMGLPNIGLHFRLDAMSAFFGIVVNLGVIASCLYGTGLDRRSELTPRVEPIFPIFVLAMNAVLLADDAFGFLFFWELMSVSSWVMVLARHEEPSTRHAAHVYLLMAGIGTIALLFAFGGLAGEAGGYAFDSIRASTRTPALSALVLAVVIIGTGSKAGIMPLHAWLPLTHPAAPSHVSALMSGVMTKVAIYGLVRILFDLMGEPLGWWALPFIALGVLTAVGALLYALMENDLKRVLAYSTMENIGIIYVGLGLALAFQANALHSAAALSMAAALLHVLNHACFKTLLFLGAGAVLHATGRRDFDGLGGLIHSMPRTAVCFLIGVLAISALPPLNGFVSEWLLFQAVLAGTAFPEPTLRLLTPIVGALLALAAALAAACFVRVYGIAFLGRPRSPNAAIARDVNGKQFAALALLSGLCVAGGLFGSFSMRALEPVLLGSIGKLAIVPAAGPTPFSLVAFDAARSTYDAVIISLFVLCSGAITMLLVHKISNRRTRLAPAWDCGYPDRSPLTQYSASSFSQPLRRVYGGTLFSAKEHIHMPPPGETSAARLRVQFHDHLWHVLYQIPATGVIGVARRLNALQFLSIRRYLVLMFVALIVLLLISAVRS